MKKILSAMVLFLSVLPIGASAENVDVPSLIIDFHASEAGHSAFADIMAGVSNGMKGEAGFISAVMHQDLDDPKHYILVEVWQTRALHEEHYQRINESGDWAHIKSLLSAEPRMYFRSPGQQ